MIECMEHYIIPQRFTSSLRAFPVHPMRQKAMHLTVFALALLTLTVFSLTYDYG